MTIDAVDSAMRPGAASDRAGLGPTGAKLGLAVSGVLLVAAAIGTLLDAGSELGTAYTFNVVAALTFTVLGALITPRQPDNPVSRLFVGIALASAMVVLSASYSSYRPMEWLNQ